MTKNGKNEEAIQKLEKSVSLFGEYSETWYWLAENYYKLGQKSKADSALVNALISNYSFGFSSKKAIDRFNEMEPSMDMKNHPIVKYRTDLITSGNFATPVSIN